MIAVEIHGVSSDGDGVGRLGDGRVVFVPDAFPGDRVSLRLTRERARVARGEVVERLEDSPHRVKSECVRERCGGCVWRGFGEQAQQEFKRRRVIETLRRVGGLDAQSLVGPLNVAPRGWRYRHRVRLHSDHSQGRWQLGFYERHTHALVSLKRCPVLWPELETVCLELERQLRNLPKSVVLRDIDVAYSRREQRATAYLRLGGDILPVREALEPLTALSGVDVVGHGARWRFGRLALRYDHRAADEFDVLFEPGAFSQAYPEMNDRLVAAVIGAVEPDSNSRILELHAGIGNLTLPLALAGAQVTAVERSRLSAGLNRRNQRQCGLEPKVIAQTDREALRTALDFDTLLIDPPRSGARAVAESAASSRAQRIVYVSCDPGTLARDLSILTGSGFALRRVEVFDFFPQTAHIESLALLER